MLAVDAVEECLKGWNLMFCSRSSEESLLEGTALGIAVASEVRANVHCRFCIVRAESDLAP